MNKSLKLKNIGKVSEVWLKEIGIFHYDDLKKIGAVEAYKSKRKVIPTYSSR